MVDGSTRPIKPLTISHEPSAISHDGDGRLTDFNLPELGENISAGDVLRVLVKPGDTIAKDQSVVELETDKATIEVPSSVAGQVKDVKVKPGDKVKVGQAILSVDDGAQVAPKQAQAKSEPAKAEAPPKADAKADAKADTKAAPAKAEAPEEHEEEDERATARPQGDGGKVVDISRGARAAAEPA